MHVLLYMDFGWMGYKLKTHKRQNNEYALHTMYHEQVKIQEIEPYIHKVQPIVVTSNTSKLTKHLVHTQDTEQTWIQDLAKLSRKHSPWKNKEEPVDDVPDNLQGERTDKWVGLETAVNTILPMYTCEVWNSASVTHQPWAVEHMFTVVVMANPLITWATISRVVIKTQLIEGLCVNTRWHHENDSTVCICILCVHVHTYKL